MSSNANTRSTTDKSKKKKKIISSLIVFILLTRVNNVLNILYCSKINAVCGDDCNVYLYRL